MTARPDAIQRFGAIWQLLHFNSIMPSQQFMQILARLCPGSATRPGADRD
jgi:hypothetical protein